MAKKASPKLSQDVLQVVAERLTETDAVKSIMRDGVYKLEKPGMYVVKGRFKSGEYKKHPFIGGEAFSLLSIYGGKSGKLIFVFKPKVPSGDYQFLELAQDQLKDMAMFSDSLSLELGMSLDDFIKANGEHLAKEEEKIEEARIAHSYGDRWGLFA